MQNFVRQWTKKSTGQCVRWFEKSTGQFKKPPAFVRFPVLNTTPAPKEVVPLLSPRIAYNVFNMDTKVGFIAKLPLILGGFFELG